MITDFEDFEDFENFETSTDPQIQSIRCSHGLGITLSLAQMYQYFPNQNYVLIQSDKTAKAYFPFHQGHNQFIVNPRTNLPFCMNDRMYTNTPYLRYGLSIVNLIQLRYKFQMNQQSHVFSHMYRVFVCENASICIHSTRASRCVVEMDHKNASTSSSTPLTSADKIRHYMRNLGMMYDLYVDCVQATTSCPITERSVAHALFTSSNLVSVVTFDTQALDLILKYVHNRYFTLKCRPLSVCERYYRQGCLKKKGRNDQCIFHLKISHLKYLCRNAVRTNPRAILHIPRELRCEDMCYVAVKRDPCVLVYLDETEKTPELIQLATRTLSSSVHWYPGMVIG